MLLKNKITSMPMSDIYMVASYLMKIIELRDQLSTTTIKMKAMMRS
jgi:hypothetical protein